MEKSFKYEIRPVKPFGEDEAIDTGFKGSFQVKIPDYKTRNTLVKAQSDVKGDFEKVTSAAYDVCSDRIHGMALTHDMIEGEITTVDELSMYKEGTAIMFDVYNMILEGWSLSPKSAKALALK